MEYEERPETVRRTCGQEAGDTNCYHAQAHGPEEHRRPGGGYEPGMIPTQRNRYFMGKYMAARDFRAEQEYLIGRHRLHNRMLHGWGIVCGLQVEHHPRENCWTRWVVIRAGMAVDCYGRELLLDRDWAIELPLPEHHGYDQGTEPEAAPGDYEESAEGERRRRPDEYLLCLEYDERDTQLVPALYAEDPCNPAEMEANRISEGVCWVWRRRDELEPICWRTPQGGPAECRPCEEHTEPEAGEETSAGHHHPTCLHPRCPCGIIVPLALIRHPAPWRREGFEIDMEGRWHLAPAGEQLTHIVGTNWTHGGAVRLSTLARPEEEGGLGGVLKIYFDRRLQPGPDPNQSNATGINAYTFTVQNHQPRDEGYSVFNLFNDGNPPYLQEPDRCVAVFPLPHDLLTGDWNLGRSTLLITLKCDFVLDCHGLPVDGNFLAGRMRTGNGVPGGVFESWIYVEADVQSRRPVQRGPLAAR